MLVGPAVYPFVLHVPAVDDPVHYLVETTFVLGLEQLEHIAVVVQSEWYVVILVFAQVGDGSPEWEPVRGAWPIQISAVVVATTIGEELLHTTGRHATSTLAGALGVAGRMRGRVRLQLIGSELHGLVTAVAVDPYVVNLSTDSFDDATMQPVLGALISHPHLIVDVESHGNPP